MDNDGDGQQSNAVTTPPRQLKTYSRRRRLTSTSPEKIKTISDQTVIKEVISRSQAVISPLSPTFHMHEVSNVDHASGFNTRELQDDALISKPDTTDKQHEEEIHKEAEGHKRAQILAIGTTTAYKIPMTEFLASLRKEDILFDSHSSSPTVINRTSSPLSPPRLISSQTTPEFSKLANSPLQDVTNEKGKGKGIELGTKIAGLRVKPKGPSKVEVDDDLDIVIFKTPASEKKLGRSDDITRRKLRKLGALPVSPNAKIPGTKQEKQLQTAVGLADMNRELLHKLGKQMSAVRAKHEAEAKSKGMYISNAEELHAAHERSAEVLEDLIAKAIGQTKKTNSDEHGEDDSDDEDFQGSNADDEDEEDDEGEEDEEDEEGQDDEEHDAEDEENEDLGAHMKVDEKVKEVNNRIQDPEDVLVPKRTQRRKSKRIIDDEDGDEDEDNSIGIRDKKFEDEIKLPISPDDSETPTTQPLEDISQLPDREIQIGISQILKPKNIQEESLPFGDMSMGELFEATQPLDAEAVLDPVSNSQVLKDMPKMFGMQMVDNLGGDSQVYVPRVNLSYNDESQTQEPTQYINEDGLLTQTKPNAYGDEKSQEHFRDAIRHNDYIKTPNGEFLSAFPTKMAVSDSSPKITRTLRQFSDSEGSDDDENSYGNAEELPQDETNSKDAVLAILRDPVQKKKSEFVDAEAEEEEDEFMGMGGGDGSDDGHESDVSEILAMIDDRKQKVNEQKISELHNKKEMELFNRGVANLLEDLQSGNLRRRRGAGYDPYDSDDEGGGILSSHARLMAKKRKINGDDTIQALESNEETRAFAQVYTKVEDDDLEKLKFLDQDEDTEMQEASNGVDTQVESSTQTLDDDDDEIVIPETVIRKSTVHLDLDEDDDIPSRLELFKNLKDRSDENPRMNSLQNQSSTIVNSSSTIEGSSSVRIGETFETVSSSSSIISRGYRSAFGFTKDKPSSMLNSLVRPKISSIHSDTRLKRFATMDDKHSSVAGAGSGVTKLGRPAVSEKNSRQWNAGKNNPKVTEKPKHKARYSLKETGSKLLSFLQHKTLT